MPDSEASIYAELNGATLGGVTLTGGTNLFKGPVRPVDGGVPAQCVFVLLTGGPPPESYLSSADADFRQSAVQVRVRSAPGAYSPTLARAVLDHLQRRSVSGYLLVRMRESEPVYIGADEQGCHEWSLNAETWWVG